MTTKIKNPDHELPIINACLADVHDMLTRSWNEIVAVRDASDKPVAISITFKIDDLGESPVVKSKMGFSRQYRDERETVVDLAQTTFDFVKDAAA